MSLRIFSVASSPFTRSIRRSRAMIAFSWRTNSVSLATWMSRGAFHARPRTTATWPLISSRMRACAVGTGAVGGGTTEVVAAGAVVELLVDDVLDEVVEALAATLLESLSFDRP